LRTCTHSTLHGRMGMGGIGETCPTFRSTPPGHHGCWCPSLQSSTRTGNPAATIVLKIAYTMIGPGGSKRIIGGDLLENPQFTTLIVGWDASNPSTFHQFVGGAACGQPPTHKVATKYILQVSIWPLIQLHRGSAFHGLCSLHCKTRRIPQTCTCLYLVCLSAAIIHSYQPYWF